MFLFCINHSYSTIVNSYERHDIHFDFWISVHIVIQVCRGYIAVLFTGFSGDSGQGTISPELLTVVLMVPKYISKSICTLKVCFNFMRFSFTLFHLLL